MASLSFEDRLGLLTDIEWASRKNNRLKKLIQEARFDQPQAHIADVNYSTRRQLDQATIATLSTCRYVEERHNVIIMGAAGSGKSYLACAFGMEACKQFFSVRFIRLPELLTDLAVPTLLILDQWMLVALKETEARDLLEIVHSRHKRASTIFCSQFAPAGWYTKIGEATLADAILDRTPCRGLSCCRRLSCS